MLLSLSVLLVGLGQEPSLVAGLYFNGQPLLTQTPAVQFSGRTFVPARAVLEALGARVIWEPGGKRLIAQSGDRRVELRVGGDKAVVNGRTVRLDAAPRLYADAVVVPLRFVATALGAQVEWDEVTRSVHIETPPEGDPVTATVRELLEGPLAFRGKSVVISGEYRGWHGSEIGHGTRHGPPTTRRDWVIRDPTGDMYVSAEAEIETPFELGPLSNFGRATEVTGLVATARKGFPYLRPLEIVAHDRPICAVKTVRDTYALGETVEFTLVLGNPSASPLNLVFMSGQQHDFVVRDAQGRNLWRWSADKAFTRAVRKVTWPPGFATEIPGEWGQAITGAGPPPREGVYEVIGEVPAQGRKLASLPHRFALSGRNKE